MFSYYKPMADNDSPRRGQLGPLGHGWQDFPHPNDASDKSWLLMASWLRRYPCLKVLTDGWIDIDRWTEGCRFDGYTISLWYKC